MSLDALMNQIVTLKRPSGTSQDDIGEQATTYLSISTTMYLEPGRGDSGFFGGTEEDAERNTPIASWFGIGRADVGFTSESQIVYGPHVLNVIAPPRLVPNPRLGTISHVELSLEEVT